MLFDSNSEISIEQGPLPNSTRFELDRAEVRFDSTRNARKISIDSKSGKNFNTLQIFCEPYYPEIAPESSDTFEHVFANNTEYIFFRL